MMSILRLDELKDCKSAIISVGWVDGSIIASDRCLLELRRRGSVGGLLFGLGAGGCHSFDSTFPLRSMHSFVVKMKVFAVRQRGVESLTRRVNRKEREV